jgi:hypothetical protein
LKSLATGEHTIKRQGYNSSGIEELIEKGEEMCAANFSFAQLAKGKKFRP